MLNLRAILDLARDLAAAIRPAPRTEPDDLTAVARAAGVYVDDFGYQPDPPAVDWAAAPTPIYDRLIADRASERARMFGGCDFDEWDRELAWEDR